MSAHCEPKNPCNKMLSLCTQACCVKQPPAVHVGAYNAKMLCGQAGPAGMCPMSPLNRHDTSPKKALMYTIWAGPGIEQTPGKRHYCTHTWPCGLQTHPAHGHAPSEALLPTTQKCKLATPPSPAKTSCAKRLGTAPAPKNDVPTICQYGPVVQSTLWPSRP